MSSPLLRLVATSAIALTTAFVQGCSASDSAPDTTGIDPFNTNENVSYTKGSVNVDKTFSDTATVQDDRLIIPTDANAAMLAKIVVGSVLAGDRNTAVPAANLATSTNPYGFLRTVKSIQTDGANTVLMTDKAELADWIDEGDLFYDETSPSLFAAANLNAGGAGGDLGAKSLKIQSGNSTGGTSGSGTGSLVNDLEGGEITEADVKVKPVVHVTNASFKLNAKFDGYFKVRKHFSFPTSVKFRSHLALDPVVQADIEAGVMLGAGSIASGKIGIGTTIGVPLWSQSIKGPDVVIPLPGPIPLTLRFAPELKCSLSATGTVTAKVHAEVNVHTAVGFEGGAGFSGFSWNDLSEAPSIDPSVKLLGVQEKATMQAECELLAVPVLLAFDSVGLQGEVGPYVQLDANLCDTVVPGGDPTIGFALYEQHGLAGEFGGRVQVPFLGAGKDFSLVSVRALKSDPLYFVGDANSCTIPGSSSNDSTTVDSCSGRKDGFYCSTVSPYAGFYCETEQVLLGHQCDGSQKCTGGTKDAITCK